MREITVTAPAKINYFLEITGSRPDGYHELSTVFQAVASGERLTLIRTDEAGIRIEDVKGLIPFPLDETNLAVRAAMLLFSAFSLPGGLLIRLEKSIPTGAGLGGGSADAAAALYGINRLFELGLTKDELKAFAVKLGADVPFFLEGGTCYASGVGEELCPLPDAETVHLLIIKPVSSASTGEIYGAYDRMERGPVRSADAMTSLFYEGGASFKEQLSGLLYNVLEPVTEKFVPEIGLIRESLLKNGALGAMMSGSGSAVFGVFKDRESAEKAMRDTVLSQEAFSSCPFFLTHTVPDGVREV